MSRVVEEAHRVVRMSLVMMPAGHKHGRKLWRARVRRVCRGVGVLSRWILRMCDILDRSGTVRRRAHHVLRRGQAAVKVLRSSRSSMGVKDNEALVVHHVISMGYVVRPSSPRVVDRWIDMSHSLLKIALIE
jgi:hypothetical protein